MNKINNFSQFKYNHEETQQKQVTLSKSISIATSATQTSLIVIEVKLLVIIQSSLWSKVGYDHECGYDVEIPRKTYFISKNLVIRKRKAFDFKQKAFDS